MDEDDEGGFYRATAPPIAVNNDPGVADDEDDEAHRYFTAKSIDNLRVAFEEFDEEGFGEIPVRKLPLLLQSKNLQATPRRWQRRKQEYQGHEETLTFQAFVDVISRKRSQSFKCAIHARDHQVFSDRKEKRKFKKERLSQDLELCLQQTNRGSTNLLSHDKNSDPFKSCASVRQMELQPSRVKCWLSDIFLSNPIDREFFLDSLRHQCTVPTFFLALSVAQLVLQGLPEFFSAMSPHDIQRHLLVEPCKRTEIWRFVSHVLIHDHVIHLTFDLVIQLTLGVVMEMTHGTNRSLTLYLGATVLGALHATSVKYPRHPPLMNATAGANALLGAYLSYFVSSSSEIHFKDWLKLFILLGVLSAHLGYVIMEWMYQEAKDFYADVGGLAVGVTLGVVILRSFGQSLYQKRSWWMTVVFYSVLALYFAAKIALQSNETCFQIRPVNHPESA